MMLILTLLLLNSIYLKVFVFLDNFVLFFSFPALLFVCSEFHLLVILSLFFFLSSSRFISCLASYVSMLLIYMLCYVFIAFHSLSSFIAAHSSVLIKPFIIHQCYPHSGGHFIKRSTRP